MGLESGRLHYHVIVEHRNPIKFSTLNNKFPGNFIEPVKKDVAALRYATKKTTAYPSDNPVRFSKGNFSFVDKSQEFKFSDLYRQVKEGKSVDELIMESSAAAWHETRLRKVEDVVETAKWSVATRKVEVIYRWGAPGSGKSLGVRADYGDRNIYFVKDYKKDPFGKYRGQKVLVLDEYHHQFDFEFLKNLLDVHPLQLGARYNNRWAQFDKVIILSNHSLESQYPEQRLNYPLSWEAFLRRISKIEYLDKPLGQEEITELLQRVDQQNAIK